MEQVGRRFSWASLPLIATVARVLHGELVLQLEYRRVQYEVVRSKVPGRIRFTDEERRRLVDAALTMGRQAMRAVVTIVKPETILRWQRNLEQREWDYSQRRRQGSGRPRTPGDIEALVCRMARENTWGYTRVQGELAKQGIKISRSGIADILRRNSLPPSPERKGLTWREFLARHKDVLLCAGCTVTALKPDQPWAGSVGGDATRSGGDAVGPPFEPGAVPSLGNATGANAGRPVAACAPAPLTLGQGTHQGGIEPSGWHSPPAEPVSGLSGSHKCSSSTVLSGERERGLRGVLPRPGR